MSRRRVHSEHFAESATAQTLVEHVHGTFLCAFSCSIYYQQMSNRRRVAVKLKHQTRNAKSALHQSRQANNRKTQRQVRRWRRSACWRSKVLIPSENLGYFHVGFFCINLSLTSKGIVTCICALIIANELVSLEISETFSNWHMQRNATSIIEPMIGCHEFDVNKHCGDSEALASSCFCAYRSRSRST